MKHRSNCLSDLILDRIHSLFQNAVCYSPCDFDCSVRMLSFVSQPAKSLISNVTISCTFCFTDVLYTPGISRPTCRRWSWPAHSSQITFSSLVTQSATRPALLHCSLLAWCQPLQAASPAIGPWPAQPGLWLVTARVSIGDLNHSLPGSLWGKWPARLRGPGQGCGGRRAAPAGSWQCGIIHCQDHSTLQPLIPGQHTEMNGHYRETKRTVT